MQTGAQNKTTKNVGATFLVVDSKRCYNATKF